jgi:hypothetical protein
MNSDTNERRRFDTVASIPKKYDKPNISNLLKIEIIIKLKQKGINSDISRKLYSEFAYFFDGQDWIRLSISFLPTSIDSNNLEFHSNTKTTKYGFYR